MRGEVFYAVVRGEFAEARGWSNGIGGFLKLVFFRLFLGYIRGFICILVG